jgi:hypothetical protein
LSNAVTISFPDDEFYSAGVSVSPNSRFLYASLETRLYQFDLFSTDIPSSKILIDTLNLNTAPPFSSVFYLSQLAPDGKIYIAGISSHLYFNVINEPHNLGLDCDFVQNGIDLLAYNFVSIPNFPNYTLGEVDSLCSQIDMEINIENVLCHGEETGSIFIEPKGGVYPFEYLWSDPSLHGQALENLPAGNYEVTIIDAIDSFFVSSIEMTEPDSLKLTTSITAEVGNQSNGSAEVITTGGTLPYSYLWNTNPPQVDSIVENLEEGIYEVIVTDFNGCTKNQMVEIDQITSTLDLKKYSALIKIYPNPTIHKLNVLLPFNRNETWRIKILDLLGNELINTKLNRNVKLENISLEFFPSGIYFYEISNNQEVVKSGKVIKK